MWVPSRDREVVADDVNHPTWRVRLLDEQQRAQLTGARSLHRNWQVHDKIVNDARSSRVRILPLRRSEAFELLNCLH